MVERMGHRKTFIINGEAQRHVWLIPLLTPPPILLLATSRMNFCIESFAIFIRNGE